MSQTAENPHAHPNPVPGSAAPAAEDPGRPALRVPWAALWVLLVSLAAVLSAALVVAARGTHGFFVPLLAGAVCIVAAIFDGSTGRIPNPLTYPAVLAGLLLNAAMPLLVTLNLPTAATWLGGPGLEQSLLGFAACAFLWVIASFFSGAIHGGDLKLLVALGALLGLAGVANVLILALMVAVLYALVNLLVAGRLNAIVGIAAARVLELVYLRRAHTPLPDDAPAASARHIPMAVPLAVGLLLAYGYAWKTGGTLL